MREVVFAVLLAVAAGCVTAGAFLVHSSAGLVVGGILLAAWAWVVLADDGADA